MVGMTVDWWVACWVEQSAAEWVAPMVVPKGMLRAARRVGYLVDKKVGPMAAMRAANSVHLLVEHWVDWMVDWSDLRLAVSWVDRMAEHSAAWRVASMAAMRAARLVGQKAAPTVALMVVETAVLRVAHSAVCWAAAKVAWLAAQKAVMTAETKVALRAAR